MDKLISIIVPVYRTEKFLNDCIESIVNQSYKSIEILLIDDDSPDSCPAICDEWARKDDRIRVFHKQNDGVAAARQFGVAMSKGEYVMFVDSDDRVREDICEYLLGLIESGKHQAACCGYSLTDDSTTPPESEEERLTVLDFEGTVKGLYDYSLWSIWAKLYKKELFEKADIPEIKLTVSEDLLTNFYLFRKCESVIISNKEKYIYFRRPDSIMTRMTLTRINDQLTAYRTICNELEGGTDIHTYSVANRLMNDFQILNANIARGYGMEFITPIADDIKQCKGYVYMKETDYCLGRKYRLATRLLTISTKLYMLTVKASGKKY